VVAYFPCFFLWLLVWISDSDEFKFVESFKGKNVRQVYCGGENTLSLTARTWVDDRSGAFVILLVSFLLFIFLFLLLQWGQGVHELQGIVHSLRSSSPLS
jgi:hypothetical protein